MLRGKRSSFRMERGKKSLSAKVIFLQRPGGRLAMDGRGSERKAFLVVATAHATPVRREMTLGPRRKEGPWECRRQWYGPGGCEEAREAGKVHI